jgi:hypothetical protein
MPLFINLSKAQEIQQNVELCHKCESMPVFNSGHVHAWATRVYWAECSNRGCGVRGKESEDELSSLRIWSQQQRVKRLEVVA